MSSKIAFGDGCWLWLASVNRCGYGQWWDGEARTIVGAHVAVYRALVGPVPDGLELDHLCRVRRCVNPAHLEPVTNAENVRRGALAATTCRAGLHPKTALGRCRPCHQAHTNASKRRARAARRSAARA